MRYLGVLFLLLAAGVSQAAEPDPRPNILFCLADDWSYPHASAYGDRVIQTPNFDRVAKEGVLFQRAYCMTPSCTPSRGAILTGRQMHQLEEGSNLWSFLPKKFETYPDRLESVGYVVGLTGKGWGPGNFKEGGRTRNPAGPNFKNFAEFLKTVPADKPFCYWFGSTDPHRPYDEGSGIKSGLKPENIALPPYFPDTPVVRSDILDYYFEAQRFDRDVGQILKQLEDSGRAKNTLVIITSDNGMPFPRCKANLHDSGTHMPLAIRWPAKVKGGRTSDAFVSLADIAPTVVEAVGLQAPKEMTARSLLPVLLADEKPKDRDMVFVERERHANVRKGDLSYPARAVRTDRWLYIRNFRPERWPAGDPEVYHSVGPYGDIDGGPTKEVVLKMPESKFFQYACAKRPAEELYDCQADPHQLNNVAGDAKLADVKAKLRATLDQWMKETGDPRATQDDDRFDKYPYYGGPAKK